MIRQSVPLLVLILVLIGCRPGAPPPACSDSLGCVTIPPGEPLKLGVIQTLSGGPANIGLDQVRSLELALAQRNNQLLGHPVHLQIEDEFCSPEGGRIAAIKLAADPQVVAVMGTTCSGAATTAAKVISEKGLVLVSGTNTAPALTSIGEQPGDAWQPGYFRTSQNDTGRAEAAAIFALAELGVTHVATLDDGDAFTRGLTGLFEQILEQNGGVVTVSARVNKGDKDMQPVLRAVADSGAELLFFSLFQPEADYVVQQANQMSEMEDILLVSGGMMMGSFVEAIGEQGAGLYFAAVAPAETEAARELQNDYLQQYGDLPTSNSLPLGYDAANLLLAAIEKAAQQHSDGTLLIGRQTLRDTLAGTADFRGVTGALTCNPFGDCGAVHQHITRLDDPAAGIEGVKANVIFEYRPKKTPTSTDIDQ